MMGDKGNCGARRSRSIATAAVPSPDPSLERTFRQGGRSNNGRNVGDSPRPNPFEPLPSEFKGPYIRLRIVFLYNLPLDYAK